jgi:hypothetical protein
MMAVEQNPAYEPVAPFLSLKLKAYSLKLLFGTLNLIFSTIDQRIISFANLKLVLGFRL